jgi:membrane protein YqaA with SNARE-associated domain
MEETPVVSVAESPKKNIARRLYDWVLSWAETKYGTPALFTLAFVESSVFPVPPDVLQVALSASKPKRAFWYATVSLAGSVLGAFLGFLIGFLFWTATQDFFYNYVFSRETFAIVAGDKEAGITREQRSTIPAGKEVKLVSRSDVPKEVHKIEVVGCSNIRDRLYHTGFRWEQEDAEQPELWGGTYVLEPSELTKRYTFQFRKTDTAGNPTSEGKISSIRFYDDEDQIIDSFDIMQPGLYHEHGFWAILITAPTPIPYKLFTIAAGVCAISLWTLFIASVLGRGARFYAVAAIMYYFGPAVMHLVDRYFTIACILFTILVVVGLVAIKYLKHFV